MRPEGTSLAWRRGYARLLGRLPSARRQSGWASGGWSERFMGQDACRCVWGGRCRMPAQEGSCGMARRAARLVAGPGAPWTGVVSRHPGAVQAAFSRPNRVPRSPDRNFRKFRSGVLQNSVSISFKKSDLGAGTSCVACACPGVYGKISVAVTPHSAAFGSQPFSPSTDTRHQSGTHCISLPITPSSDW